MNCPRCHTADLVEKDRTGIMIDICPSCRGVWLDRGELEKLIAMARGDDDDDRAVAARRGDERGGYVRRDDDDDDDDRRHRGKKRSSWFDIFD